MTQDPGNDKTSARAGAKPDGGTASKPGLGQKMRKAGNLLFPVNEMKSSYKIARSSFDSIIRGTEGSPRNETFYEAVGRLDLDQDALAGASRRQRVIFYINFVLSCLIAIYALVQIVFAQDVTDVFVAIASFGPAALFAVVAFRASFRAWQIRESRLGGFEEFKSNWHLWWPRPPRETGAGLAVKEKEPKAGSSQMARQQRRSTAKKSAQGKQTAG